MADDKIKEEFYYISYKWTHPEDAFITFWRENNCGYCWYKDWAGVYERICYGDEYGSSITVFKSEVDKLWMDVDFDGAPRKILPNTKEVRKILGLKKKDFYKVHRSGCPSAKKFFQPITNS